MSNIELNLVDHGQGEPAIIFIHGFTCNLSNWNEQLSGLSGGHRCVAVDLPGHGASAAPREATVETLAEAVNDRLDRLKLNEVVVVGHSMGCRLVSETYNQSPGRVRGVVYVDGSMVAVGDPDEAVRKMIGSLDRIGMADFIERLYEGFYVESTPAKVRNFVNAGMTSIDMDFARELWLNVVRWDASRSRAALAAIEVPALAIQSTYLDTNLKRVSIVHGQTTPWIDAVANAVKDVTVVVIEGVGHFPMLEAARETNDAISNFVRRVATG
ncbi:MAG: alpha/beta hydrolase [Betaproteobacteria bacterium]|nr:MAG: alpha/beta hydrolase [Betaproteobacteria bacterium]